MTYYMGAQLGAARGGEKHDNVGADIRSCSAVAGHDSTPEQRIPCAVVGPKLAGGWATMAGNWPKRDLVKRKLFLL
jgi:hypothetical protein